MNNQEIKTKVLSSLFWKLMERGGTQGIQFIVTIILARILLPEEFGLIVLVTIFVAVAGVFVQSGFNTALIQKKKIDEVDFSSVFYLSLFTASLLYIVLFGTAPFIAKFFGEHEILLILRVLALTLFFGAFNSIQVAVISRNMQFKKLFISSLGAVIISAIVGIVMAFLDYGVWALVAQQLTNQILVTLILLITVRWRPKLIFSLARISDLFSFGWKMLVSSLIDTLYKNITSLIIGKIFDTATLGFYNRGEQFPNLVISNINGSIQSVMLPTLSAYQDNKIRIKVIVRRSIVISSFLIFPTMVGLAAIAEPFIEIVLTKKWLPAVPFLQIFCASYALWPIHTANLQAITALGRSDIFLKLEIIKKILGLIIVGISIPFGVYAMALGILIISIISTFINAYPNSKLIDYSLREQCKDIIPSMILSLIMGLAVYSLNWLGISVIITLTLQVLLGITLYIVLAKVFKLESYSYLISTIDEFLKRKGNRSI